AVEISEVLAREIAGIDEQHECVQWVSQRPGWHPGVAPILAPRRCSVEILLNARGGLYEFVDGPLAPSIGRLHFTNRVDRLIREVLRAVLCLQEDRRDRRV